MYRVVLPLTFAESITHISHRLTFTALRSALLSGDPCERKVNARRILTDEIERKRFPYIKNRNLRKVLKSLPFSSEVLHSPHDDNMLELVVVEVGGPEGHHQVPQPNQGAVRVGKQTNHHVAVQDCHCGLVPVLRDDI